VVDDYGHHPTEIRATLATAKSCCRGRMHVLFQPHRYSRTFHLLDDFARAFHQADRVLVLDIYGASEKPIEGVNAEVIVERMRQFGHRGAAYAVSNAVGVETIVQGLEPGDMILTLCAGSVSQLGDKILERLALEKISA
jgi:UDP-N-acetylmuramate--alanine ligase